MIIGRGRKSLWDEMDVPSLLDSIRGWAMQGSSDQEMCQMLGISKNTFYKWKNEKKEFKDALRNGRGVATGALVNSAYRQAMGYRYSEDMVTPSGQVVEVEKFQAPNASMTMFLLKNWMPNKYSDRREVPAEDKDRGNVEQLFASLKRSQDKQGGK